MQIFSAGALEIWPEARRITISPCGRLVRFALTERILSSRGIRTPGPGIASRNDFVLPQAGEGDEWPGWSIVVHDAHPTPAAQEAPNGELLGDAS